MWIYVPRESYQSAPEPGASTSASAWRSQMLASSVALSGKLTLPKSLLRAWKRVPWMKRLFGRISEPSTAQRGVDAWMGSLEGSRALQSPKPAKDWESMMSDGFGPGSKELFARLGSGGAFLKTFGGFFQQTLDGSSDLFSEALPVSGSMRSGSLYRLPTSAPATKESESSSWLTPCGMTGTDHTGKAGSGGELHMQAQAWGTPQSSDWKDKSHSRDKNLHTDLNTWADPRWTTPKVQDERHGTASPSELRRNTPTLAAQAHFPTPTAKDADGSRDTSQNPGSRRHKGKTLTDASENVLWRTPAANEVGPKPGTLQDKDGGPPQIGHRIYRKTPDGKLVNTQQTIGLQAENWPTPNVPNGGRAMSKEDVEAKGSTPTGKRQVDLGSAATHWPTPSAQGSAGEDSPDLERKGSKLVNSKTGRILQTNLATEVKHWPTPRTLTGGGESAERKKELGREEAGGGDLQAAAEDWPTPQAHDSTGGRGSNNLYADGHHKPHDLSDAVDAWPTPAARDHKGANSKKHVTETGTGRKHMDQLANFVEHSPSSPQVPVTSVHGGELSPTDLSTASRRRLNPAFVCWLMGWPWWWTNPGEISFARRATELYLFRLRTLLESLLRERV